MLARPDPPESETLTVYSSRTRRGTGRVRARTAPREGKREQGDENAGDRARRDAAALPVSPWEESTMAFLQCVGAQIDAGGFEYECAVVPPLPSDAPRGAGGVLVERINGHIVGVLAFRVFHIGDEVGLARGGSLVAVPMKSLP